MARQRLGRRCQEFHFASGVAGGDARAAAAWSDAARSGAWTGARTAAWCERQRDASPLARRTAAARAGEVDAATAALVIVGMQCGRDAPPIRKITSQGGISLNFD